jgi:hypothetical protein
MSKIRIALVFVFTSISMTLASSSPPQVDEWELVAKLCGKLEHTQQIPPKRFPGEYSEKNDPIQNAKLVAYEAPNNSVCCSKARVAGEAITNKSGYFEFKGLTNGYYWLVARVEEREYQMSIRIAQLKDKQPVCSQMSFTIDAAGKIALRIRAPGR